MDCPADERVTRWQKGRMQGGDEGRRMIEETEARRRSQRVRDIARFVATLAPAIGGVARPGLHDVKLSHRAPGIVSLRRSGHRNKTKSIDPVRGVASSRRARSRSRPKETRMRIPCRSLWLVVPSAALALLAGCASS